MPIKHLKIHKEGRRILFSLLVLFVVINAVLEFLIPAHYFVQLFVLTASILSFVSVAYFFRNPLRLTLAEANQIIAPADGRVVVIEEVMEPEYFNDKRIQLSIFMSPANVHVNRTPISGHVKYIKYHPGKYLVAWHPKSSTNNERNTVVIENEEIEVMVRQIAGAVARRIVSYLDEGEYVDKGTELGFIKFGSRVDVFLPVGSDIKVQLNQKVKGGETVLAELV